MKSQFIPSDKPEGRYKDIEKIATGGMGIVFRAIDTVLDKPVAIKTIIFDSMTEFYVPRFQREAKLISKLNHPNIVNILDFGITREQEPYMVMDFVEGSSLEEQLKEGKKYSIDEIKETVLQICRGMKHAHSKGIVHRDLKPSNILLAKSSLPGQNVKVIDFGIAKEVDPEQGFNTSGEVLAGSPHYMSPEQIQHNTVDERTDIYSLGCIMYKMLFGVPPFSFETALDTMQAHLENEPEILQSDQSKSDEFQGLVEIILVCLNKKPADRFASIDELTESFTELKTFEHIATANISQVKSGGKSKSTNKFLVLVGVISFALFSFVLFQQNFVNDSKNQKVHQTLDDYPPAKEKQPDFRLTRTSGDLYSLKVNNCSTSIDKSLSDLAKRGLVIEKANLQDSKISNDSLKYLVKFPIVSLNVERTNINHLAAIYIKQMKELRELNVGNTAFGDKGIEKLENPKLGKVHFSSSDNVTDLGIKTIAEKWPHLFTVDVSYNSKVTEDGLVELAKLRSAQYIVLNGLSISDKLAKVYSENLKTRRIQLKSAKISKIGVERIAEIPQLEYLDLGNTLSEQRSWYKELQDKHPNIEIISKQENPQMEGFKSIY